MKFAHKLGWVMKDAICGFEGVVVMRCQHLTGCNQYGIAPRQLHDGKQIETQFFDEGRLIFVEEGVTVEEVAAPAPGGEKISAASLRSAKPKS